MALSTIAILIGVISIVPIMFLNSGVAKAEITVDNPWSSLTIPYAYCNPYADYSNITGSFVSSMISMVGNITVSGDAYKNAIGRIEYYQLQVYSDQDQIYNMTYYVGLFRS
ncbi:MAG: hypothetical protein GX638_15460, partial [Crenarchaeota archaeon]|nr:hypothetical protein [Thermoproteota archaeon]